MGERTEAEMLLNVKSGITDSAWQVVTTEIGKKRSRSTVGEAVCVCSFSPDVLELLEVWDLF